jgi:tetratricopeptide (TPR) repeat protein
MIRTAKMLAFGPLIVVVAGLLVSAACAQAVNKPSNPQAQDRLLAISSTWDSNDPATYDNAARSFESVRSEYPGTLEAELAYVELLRIRWVKGEQEAVLAEYQRWLGTAPSPAAQGHILCYFANYAAKVGDAKRAEELCKSAISLAGDHIVAGLAAIELAKMYVRTPGREAEALALYEQTTRKFTGTRIEWICRREWARGLNAYSPSAT